MDEHMTDELKHPEGELTRLADGSLPADRQADLLAQIRQSPELTAAFAEQERAVTMLRALDEPAPVALRARVDELTGTAPRRAAPRAGGAPSCCPAPPPSRSAAAAVVVLVSGGGAAPTVPVAARLALASATLPRRRSTPASPRTSPSPQRASPSPRGARRRAGRRTAPAPTRWTGAGSPPSSTWAATAAGSATRSPTARRCRAYTATPSPATACASPSSSPARPGSSAGCARATRA